MNPTDELKATQVTDSPADPSGDHTRAAPRREAVASRPRWVKVSVVLAVLLVVMIGVMLISGGGPGGHGPGRHTGASSSSDDAGPTFQPHRPRSGHVLPKVAGADVRRP